MKRLGIGFEFFERADGSVADAMRSSVFGEQDAIPRVETSAFSAHALGAELSFGLAEQLDFAIQNARVLIGGREDEIVFGPLDPLPLPCRDEFFPRIVFVL